MAKLRSASAYRRIKRAYTRYSKYRKKSYIRSVPTNKVVKYDLGDLRRSFPVHVTLIATKDINLRHNAIEAARVTTTRYLETTLGKDNFHLKVRAVPHHIIRENPLATGAGADRFQEGMSRSFGIPKGRSARIFKGAPLFTVGIEAGKEPVAKEAFRKANSKIPVHCAVQLEKV